LPESVLRPTVADVSAAMVAAGEPTRSPLEHSGVRASAVLVALYDHHDEAHVVLTRRAQHLRSHRGEVSFPGGGQDPGEDLRRTALREAEEEVGLDPASVEIIGQLDHRQTITSRSFIIPFVGILAGRPELTPSPAEVELILHVSLAELLAADVFREERWGLPPLDRPIYFFEIAGDTVWGATASMLRNLLALITGTPWRDDGW
jgi:8-oxo-dGTP pyrophosphatase MutT (NUDIX family)